MTQCRCCKSPTRRSDMARWTMHACADGGRKRTLWLCGECDAMLNRQLLILLGDPNVNAKMARYRQVK